MRSGTAIGANHREAITAESEVDFVHKLAIAQQEVADKQPSSADKVRHAVRKTVVTKRLVDLFLKNMSENDRKQ